MPDLKQHLVEPHPGGDSGASTLPVIFDLPGIKRLFQQALTREYGTITEFRFRVLKQHPGSRCTFEISLRNGHGWGYLIGKIYAADRADVYRVMEGIRQAGFGPEGEFSIPRPVAYIPQLHLLIQEKVEGPRAKQIFLAGAERDRIEVARRCARWLAKFHTSAPARGRVLDPIQHRHSIARWSQRIEALGQPLADLSARLSSLLEAGAAPAAHGMEMCAGHGSYNCNQIIVRETQVSTYDWDGYDVADPCRDVARFVVALQRLAFKYLGSLRALDAAAEAFLNTYEAMSPLTLSARLPWYRALACLQLSKYEVNRPVCTFRRGIEAMLREGIRSLEQ